MTEDNKRPLLSYADLVYGKNSERSALEMKYYLSTWLNKALILGLVISSLVCYERGRTNDAQERTISALATSHFNDSLTIESLKFLNETDRRSSVLEDSLDRIVQERRPFWKAPINH